MCAACRRISPRLFHQNVHEHTARLPWWEKKRRPPPHRDDQANAFAYLRAAKVFLLVADSRAICLMTFAICID